MTPHTSPKFQTIYCSIEFSVFWTTGYFLLPVPMHEVVTDVVLNLW